MICGQGHCKYHDQRAPPDEQQYTAISAEERRALVFCGRVGVLPNRFRQRPERQRANKYTLVRYSTCTSIKCSDAHTAGTAVRVYTRIIMVYIQRILTVVHYYPTRTVLYHGTLVS